MSRETQPLPVESQPQVNSTARKTSPLRATGSEGRKTAKLATGSLESKKPPKSKPKPATVPGCYWTADWKLRRSARDEAGNNPFIGQLSQGKYRELKAEAKSAQKPVADILKEWAEAKAAEKGIQL